MNKDVIFIFTSKSQGMILDCRKTGNDQYEIMTKCYGLLRVCSVDLMTFFIDVTLKDTGRQSVRQPLCSIDTKHGLILLRVIEGVIKLIYLKDFSSKESSSPKSLEAYNVK
jgi:hypothetical protein